MKALNWPAVPGDQWHPAIRGEQSDRWINILATRPLDEADAPSGLGLREGFATEFMEARVFGTGPAADTAATATAKALARVATTRVDPVVEPVETAGAGFVSLVLPRASKLALELFDVLATQVPDLIAVEQRQREAVSRRTAASLFVLEYARRLSWPVLAHHLRDSTWLDPDTANVYLQRDGSMRARVGFGAGPVPHARSTAQVVHRVVVTHLGEATDLVAADTGISRTILWSNVAAAMAAAFVALSWGSRDRCRYLHTGVEALAAEHRLEGLVTLAAVEHAGERWLSNSRHACCLAFHSRPGGRPAPFCGSCPHLDECERLRRFRRAVSRYRATESAASPPGRGPGYARPRWRSRHGTRGGAGRGSGSRTSRCGPGR